MNAPLYEIEVTTLDGRPAQLKDYAGSVLLIVNTASQCGLTPQYEGLEALYQRYAGQGLVVLGFPCNQFGRQEPGNSEEISTFCQKNYGVSFPMFEKIDVNGDSAHPLYKYLKSERAGLLGIEAIKWNFTKFLVDRSGNVVKRFAPTDAPDSLVPEIEKLLAASS